MIEYALVMLSCLAFGVAGYALGRRESSLLRQNTPTQTTGPTYWTPERLANLQNRDVSGSKPAHEAYEAGLPTRLRGGRG